MSSQISLFRLLFEGLVTNAEGFWGDRAAGILLMARDTGRWLVLLRSDWVNEPGTWGIAGGKLDDPEESPEEAARREATEELGGVDVQDLESAYVFTSPNGTFKYHNFLGVVPSEFKPDLGDGENVGFKWLTFDELKKLRNKHFGLSALLANSGEMIQKMSGDAVKSSRKSTRLGLESPGQSSPRHGTKPSSGRRSPSAGL